MANNFTVTIEGLSEAVSNITNLKDQGYRKIRFLNKQTASRIVNRAKNNVTVDRGELKESIQYRLDELEFDVFSSKYYAPYVEYGTAPHFPPPSALRGWAARHGMAGAEFAIARKISREGTPAQPFLRPAYEIEKSYYLSEMKKLLRSLGQ